MNQPAANNLVGSGPAARLASLDYLRGLAAFGIVVFHYVMWVIAYPDSSGFFGRVGVYGVAIFYILSGITLFHVYDGQIGGPSKKGLIQYAFSRFFRIFPLLWLLTIATLAIKREEYTVETIILNFTGLFSVHHWGDTICYGAWSIGNELVFYLFFPVFIFLSRKSKPLFFVFSTLLLFIFLWYTFRVMDGTQKMTAAYWISFINPLDQVFLFLGGYLIGYFTRNITIPRYYALPLIAVGVLAFIYYPVSGDTMMLVSGFNRIAFTAICFVLCLGVYKTRGRLPGPLHTIFGTLGEISYSLYLLHPLSAYIFPRVAKGWFDHHSVKGIVGGIIFALLLSLLLYRFFERPFMAAGKYFSRKLINRLNL